jgi:hypothetical protein
MAPKKSRDRLRQNKLPQEINNWDEGNKILSKNVSESSNLFLKPMHSENSSHFERKVIPRRGDSSSSLPG